MKRKTPSALDYPLVIKKHHDEIVLTMPDLNITVTESSPQDGKIDNEFVLRLAKSLSLTWLKATAHLHNRQVVHSKEISPSLVKSILDDAANENDLSTTEACALLKVSENSLRRMVDKGALPCYRTEGRHRRFLKKDIHLFLEHRNLNKSEAQK